MNSLLLHFRRITSSVAYVPEIDGIRFIAIASVFLFHLAGDILRHSPAGYGGQLQHDWVFWLTQNGNFGVQLFFVLSGFLLALPFAAYHINGEKAVNLTKYFKRRLTRLEPPYLAALLFFFVLKLAAGRDGFSNLLPHLLSSVFYIHNLVYARPSDVNFVAWSLEVEVQYYLLAPVLTAILFRPRSALLRRSAIVALALLVTFLSLLPHSQRADLSILGQGSYFLAGLLLADCYVTRTASQRGRIGWDIATIIPAATIFLLLRNFYTLAFFGPFAVFFVYYGVFHGQLIRKALSHPVISTIGGMCYSIYLVHNYVIAACGMYSERLTASLPFHQQLLIQTLIMAPVVLFTCGIFYLLIERPCMRPDWPARTVNWFRSIRARRTETAQTSLLETASSRDQA